MTQMYGEITDKLVRDLKGLQKDHELRPDFIC